MTLKIAPDESEYPAPTLNSPDCVSSNMKSISTNPKDSSIIVFLTSTSFIYLRRCSLIFDLLIFFSEYNDDSNCLNSLLYTSSFVLVLPFILILLTYDLLLGFILKVISTKFELSLKIGL